MANFEHFIVYFVDQNKGNSHASINYCRAKRTAYHLCNTGWVTMELSVHNSCRFIADEMNDLCDGNTINLDADY